MVPIRIILTYEVYVLNSIIYLHLNKKLFTGTIEDDEDNVYLKWSDGTIWIKMVAVDNVNSWRVSF